jgi:PST family polysaccharide transporter
MQPAEVKLEPAMDKNVKLSEDMRAVISNIGWLSSDRLIRMGGAVLVSTVVARYLGPSQFGLLNLAIAIYMLFNILSNLGLDYLLVRDIVMHPDADQELLGTSFYLKVFASILTTVSAICFAWISNPGNSMVVIIVALLSISAIAQGFDVIEYYFQAKTLSRYSVVPKAIVFVAASIARIYAVLLHYPLLTFAWIGAIEMLLSEAALLISYWVYRNTFPKWKFQYAHGSRLLKESWPLVLASLLVMIYMRTDQIMLGMLTNNRVVGYYSAAVRLSEIWYIIPTLICSSVMPRLLTYFNTHKAFYYRRIQLLYNYLVLISVTLALSMSIFSRPVVVLALGHDYLPAAEILTVHIWTGVFVFIGVLGGQQLIHENLVKIELQRAFLGAIANIGLNVVLIPRYGGIGSACATLVAQATASYFSDALNPRTRHLFRMKTYALSGLWLLRGEYR